MGVPKFFRYISERYPCLSEKMKEYQIPEFDNLYLDMNGIIHNCSHPNDADVQFRISEENIFKNIFHYIEILFRMIQPQKLFFMAVDGVAPRAKINQQRGRRFRSAREAELLEKKAQSKGVLLPKESRFDSNCITPGTLFMAKLTKHLKYFITYKISTDKQWKKCKIILSGSEVPGEGEHKIMDYIRYMKSQPDHDSNTRHCLYGLDADLIMLGLCTHEPHFSLLREEVVFGKKQKKILTPEETNFCLLHLSLMREYLEHEFAPIKDKLSTKFDIEKIIDDWVLMGFLVGNDFIPNLPNLHINHGALPILYNAYMEVLPTLEGYINEAGTLNLERFEKFMERLSQFDVEQFEEVYADLKYFEAKTGRRPNESERLSLRNSEDIEDFAAASAKPMSKDLANLIKATEDSLLLDSSEDEDFMDEDSDSEIYKLEFAQHKRDYYMKKMDYHNVDEQVLRSQAEGYVRAIQWNLHYYYNGCCSWSWYYPHHYAPYISDIKDFKDLKLEFDMGEPFLPFQQLLAVLPAASRELLPSAYQNLLTETESPIIDYYPLDFKTDLNGKRQEWEAVVLIPFIDEKHLINAMTPHDSKLTKEEKERNMHGPMCIFTYTETDLGEYSVPEYFPTIKSHAKCKFVNRDEILVPEEKLVKGLYPGVKLSVYFPGFPTLQHIEHTASLQKAKVKVFEQPSRGENMILKPIPKPKPDLSTIANQLLGKSVFVGWPNLIEALVVGVSDDKWKIQCDAQGNHNNPITEEVDGPLVQQRILNQKAIIEHHKLRLGIDVGKIDILIHARPMVGRKYIFGSQGKLTLEKEWSDYESTYAYQLMLREINVYNSDFIQYSTVSDVFKPKSVCFMLGHPHYGAMGEVNDPGVDVKTGRVKIAVNIYPKPNFDDIKQKQREMKLLFMHGSKAAQHLGISSFLLSKITGSILVMPGSIEQNLGGVRQNIGLSLKFNKRNEEVPGFTRKDNGVWLYSTKTVELLRNYIQNFPTLFENLGKNINNEMYFATDLFGKETELLDKAVVWVKEQQENLNIESRTCGTESLDAEIVASIEKKVDSCLDTIDKTYKTVFMQVKPHLLFKPSLNPGHFPPDIKAYHKVFDRIITVRESFTVPLGHKGTIVGVQKGQNIMDNIFEIIFDKPFVGGMVIHGCSENRGYRLSARDFINLSYGLRVELGKSGKTEPPPPQESWRSNISYTPPRESSSAFVTFNYFNQFPPSGFAKHGETKFPFTRTMPSMPGKSGVVGEIKTPIKTQQLPFSNVSGQDARMMNMIAQPMHNKSSQQLNNAKDPSEFQALWNGMLQKSNMPQQPPIPANLPKQIEGNKNSPQDPSAFLKAMLKISDESTKSSSPSSIPAETSTANKPFTFPQPPIAPKTSDAPPLVQRLFDLARENEKKREGKWYSSQLLSYFQHNCKGLPRYQFINNKQNNLVCAQIFLPDMRVFCGEFCSSYPEATENAAKKVYEELQLDRVQNTRILAPPPPQWFNARFSNNNNLRPPMPPLPPQIHQMNHQPMRNQPPMPFNPVIPPMAPCGNMRPRNPAKWNKPGEYKKSTPFVPLQAQKQNRNINKPTNEKLPKEITKEPSEKKGNQNLKENTQKKPKEEKTVHVKVEDKKNVTNNSQKTQKTGNQRKSRIAANFSSAALPNGGNKQ